ncbi:hypothetical protein [Antarcticirhabdus aurantiaca]|uniref:Uncharacterized protein n=1 Tax=Antarcticirhabdus aurantiaca TaxID=2606717 RepID=A0ACD4NLV2_9HYPH|nr:hypothetical protein [Antarcticirhabdus aurantiaca]WAJ27850.1 hypothetical protein OXU80_23895 [Jeongeuplla avenae]
MTLRRLRPFRQGELDALCGIYAAINAIRLALGRRGEELSIEDWAHLFGVMVASADVEIGAVTATTVGIHTKPLLAILGVAAQHMSDEHGIGITVARFAKRRERPPLEEALARLSTLIDQPGSAVILPLEGYLDHWSVLRWVGTATLELFDSYGFSRVSIANCRMTHEPARLGRREHIIRARAILLVDVRS